MNRLRWGDVAIPVKEVDDHTVVTVVGLVE
jgi:hypothetical protein